MSAPETAAATAEQVKPTEAPITSKDPVVRTVVTALRRVLKHTVIQETPKEEVKTEVRLSSSFLLLLFNSFSLHLVNRIPHLLKILPPLPNPQSPLLRLQLRRPNPSVHLT